MTVKRPDSSREIWLDPAVLMVNFREMTTRTHAGLEGSAHAAPGTVIPGKETALYILALLNLLYRLIRGRIVCVCVRACTRRVVLSLDYLNASHALFFSSHADNEGSLHRRFTLWSVNLTLVARKMPPDWERTAVSIFRVLPLLDYELVGPLSIRQID